MARPERLWARLMQRWRLLVSNCAGATMPTKPPAVYLAGPDVFLPDPLAMAAAKKRLCAELGFEGVFPMDSEIEASNEPSSPEKARQISLANEALMRSCDLLV